MLRTPHTLALSASFIALVATSCATAQQPPSESRESFAYQMSDGDGISVELRIENGRVVTAKIDGNTIPADRVRKAGDGYDILSADGKVVRHIPAAGHGAGQTVRRSVRVEAPNGPRAGEERDVIIRRGESSAQSSSESRSSSSGGRPQSESRAQGRARGNARAEGDAAGMARREQDAERAEARSRARIRVDGGPEWRERGEAEEAPKSMIGIGLGVPDAALAHHLKIDRTKCTMVTNVVDGLPADAAGIEQYDVIVSVNGDRNASSEAIRRVLREAEPGGKVSLEVMRGGETRKVEVTAVEFNGEKLAFAEPLEVQGFDMPELDTMFEDGEGGTAMFFIGPDGQQHEMRMPGLPGMVMRPNGANPEQMAEFERMMEGFNRRMEDWSRQIERRMREPGPPNGGEAAPAPDAPRPRGDAGNDERMRRMEERLDQLMRELERERASKRDRKDA